LLYAMPDTAGARAAAQRAIALDSAFYEPYHLLTWLEIGNGNVPAARQALERGRVFAGGDFWIHAMIDGHLRVMSGDTAGARAVLKAMKPGPLLAQQAWLLRTVGDTNASYAMFERAVSARDTDALWVLASSPLFYPARREPRFQALLARAKLTPEPPR